MPPDRPRQAVQTYAGAAINTHLTQPTVAALGALARSQGATLFAVLTAALSVLVMRYGAQTDVNLGTVVANRSRKELEPLLGLFLDTLVIRTRLDPAQDFCSLVSQVRQTVLEAQAHQALPFVHVLNALAPPRRPGLPPLFQVMLLLQNMPTGKLELPGLTLEPLELDDRAAKFDITLYASESDGTLELAWEYDRTLFDAATIERLAARYTRLLVAAAAFPGSRIDELGLDAQVPAARPTLAAAAPGSRCALSHHQQRLLFIDLFETGTVYPTAPTYHNIPPAAGVRGGAGARRPAGRAGPHRRTARGPAHAHRAGCG